MNDLDNMMNNNAPVATTTPSWEKESEADTGVKTAGEVRVQDNRGTPPPVGQTQAVGQAPVQNNGRINLYEDPIQGVAAPVSEWKRFARTFTVYSSTSVLENGKTVEKEIPATVIQDVVTQALLLAEAGFTFNYNGDLRDPLSTAVKNAIPDSTQCYMAWKSINPEFTSNFVKPTLLAYQYTAAFYSFTNPRTQQVQNPFTECKLPDPIRAIKAAETMTLIGASCKTPVKLVMAYTHNGIKSKRELTRESDFKSKSFVPMCETFDTPLFNLKNDGALDGLKQLVATFTS